jgi:hypothetical protein
LSFSDSFGFGTFIFRCTCVATMSCHPDYEPMALITDHQYDPGRRGGVHLIRPANPRSISSRLREGGLCVLPLHGAIVMPVPFEIVLVEYKFDGKAGILWLHPSRLTKSGP